MLITGGARAGEIEGVALEDLTAAERFKQFRNNRFPLNIDKTQSMVWPATQAAANTTHVKLLGSLINNWLSCQHHIDEVCTMLLLRVFSSFGPRRLRSSLTEAFPTTIYQWTLSWPPDLWYRLLLRGNAPGRSLLRLQAITSSTHCRPMFIFSGLKILIVNSHYIYSLIVYVKRNVQEPMTREISG